MVIVQPRTWETINNLISNPFSVFNSELTAIGITVNDAQTYFLIDYDIAYSVYSDDYIQKIFELVHNSNIKKYQKLIAVYNANYDPVKNYDMTETSTDIRTPELESDASSTTSSTSTVKNNQSKTSTDTPNNYTETSIHSVNPYDNTGLRTESQNSNSITGTRTMTESYAGAADESATTNTATTTTTTTGTDTNTHTLSRSGNIGVTTSQQMLESELQLADKMNIFKIIERDIAKKLFIQVW